LKIELQQKHEHYISLAEQYKDTAASKGSVQLFAGGLTKSGKEAERSNTDRVDPKFTRSQDQFPGTGEEGIGST